MLAAGTASLGSCLWELGEQEHPLILQAGRRGQGHSSEGTHHYAWLLTLSGAVQNPIFLCPAPFPGGKAELAVKVKERHCFLQVPLELLAEVFSGGKGSKCPWRPPTQHVATWSRCPSHWVPIAPSSQAEGLLSPVLPFTAPWRSTSLTRC